MTAISTDAAALAANARDQAHGSNPDVDAQTLLLAEVAIRPEDVSAQLAARRRSNGSRRIAGRHNFPAQVVGVVVSNWRRAAKRSLGARTTQRVKQILPSLPSVRWRIANNGTARNCSSRSGHQLFQLSHKLKQPLILFPAGSTPEVCRWACRTDLDALAPRCSAGGINGGNLPSSDRDRWV
jgi:hypothetical protein